MRGTFSCSQPWHCCQMSWTIKAPQKWERWPCLQQLFCRLLCLDEPLILVCLIALLCSPFKGKLGALGLLLHQEWKQQCRWVMLAVTFQGRQWLHFLFIFYFIKDWDNHSVIDWSACFSLSHLIDFLEVRHEWCGGEECSPMHLAPCLSRKQRKMIFFFWATPYPCSPFDCRQKCSMTFILGLSLHFSMHKLDGKKSIQAWCKTEQSVCQERQLPVLYVFVDRYCLTNS